MQPSTNASRRLSRAFINKASSHICPRCRDSSHNPLIARGLQQIRYVSSDNLPFTEKLRRKIWGTDNPPGLKDPYGGPSFLERRKMRKEAEREAAADASALGPSREHKRTTSYRIPEEEEDPAEQPGAVVAADAPVMEEYREAETWDGLQHIGHKGHWRDLPPEPSDGFQSWIQSTNVPAMNRAELLSCLYQAIVECLACQKLGLNTKVVCDLRPDIETYDAIFATEIRMSADGQLMGLDGPIEFIEHAIHQQLVREARNESEVETNVTEPPRDNADNDIFAEENKAFNITGEVSAQTEAQIPMEDVIVNPVLPTISAEKLQQPLDVVHYAVPNEHFLSSQLDFTQPITFSILKRFSQLSRHKIPDPTFNALVQSTNSSLPKSGLSLFIDNLTKSIQPRPKNLAEILSKKPDLVAQSNVMVLSRRETPVDKHKEVGRWKVIERELEKRGLPVLGKLTS